MGSNVHTDDEVYVEYLGNLESLTEIYSSRKNNLHVGTTFICSSKGIFYVHTCTPSTLSGKENPTWTMVSVCNPYHVYLKQQFNKLSLEEKVDFLIDKYIESITSI